MQKISKKLRLCMFMCANLAVFPHSSEALTANYNIKPVPGGGCFDSSAVPNNWQIVPYDNRNLLQLYGVSFDGKVDGIEVNIRIFSAKWRVEASQDYDLHVIGWKRSVQVAPKGYSGWTGDDTSIVYSLTGAKHPKITINCYTRIARDGPSRLCRIANRIYPNNMDLEIRLDERNLNKVDYIIHQSQNIANRIWRNCN